MRCKIYFDGSISSLNCRGPVETCAEGQYCIYQFHTDTETGERYLEKGCVIVFIQQLPQAFQQKLIIFFVLFRVCKDYQVSSDKRLFHYIFILRRRRVVLIIRITILHLTNNIREGPKVFLFFI